MPKERIESAGYRQFDIIVGWDKEAEYAQLAVVQYPEDEPAIKIGKSDEVFDGLWATLSPEVIDELIKVLRKAKRQAFPKPV
jgi:hypothetical protein